MSKRCPQCSETKLLDEFAVDRSKRSGHKGWCKVCDNARAHAYYEANAGRKLEYAAQRAKDRPKRRCLRCGGLATSQKHWFCDACRADGARRPRKDKRMRVTTKDRGYGATHRRLRRRWARDVELGGVRCARCGELISPGEPWDLGHFDADRAFYNGPEHRRCNRATAGRKRRTSREW